MSEAEFVVEAVDDPAHTEPIREQIDRGRRNREWLSAQWALLLPQARGRFVAVAGQEAYLADSAEDAWAWTRTAHPEDDGAIVQYVRREQGPRIMRIAGTWYKCDDGLIRPVLLVRVRAVNGSAADERFLIDSGADRTVFSATLLSRLGGPTAPAPRGLSLAGVGGTQAFVQVEAALEMARADGGTASVRGDFAPFTDPTATDLSVLDRDVLNHFDLILSRRLDEIVLFAGHHRFPRRHLFRHSERPAEPETGADRPRESTQSRFSAGPVSRLPDLVVRR